LYNSPKETRLFGKKINFLPECSSTNTEAIRFISEQGIIHGMVVICGHQSAGRGQAGNVWESEPGKNLTFSLVLENPINSEQSFYLNIFLSLAIAKALKSITNLNVQVKWPNDLMVGNKKIGGLLIESAIQGNRLRYAVLGIGLNVNQVSFKIDSASSLSSLTGKTFSLNEIFSEVLLSIEKHFELLKANENELLKQEWLEYLYLRGVKHLYKKGQQTFEGIIQGIDDHGRLMLQSEGQIQVFNFKEITF